MIFFKNPILLTFLFVLSGCAQLSFPKKFDMSTVPEGHGVIVGSYTRFKSNTLEGRAAYGRYASFFRRSGDLKAPIRKSLNSIGVSTDLNINFPDKNINEDDVEGVVFIRTLPLGEYEFYEHGPLIIRNYTTYTLESSLLNKRPFSVEFDVKPGVINYIGELRNHDVIWDHKKKGLLGNHEYDVVGVVLSVIDNYERDVALLREKYPNISALEIESGVPQGGRNTNMMVHFKELSDKDIDLMKDALFQQIIER